MLSKISKLVYDFDHLPAFNGKKTKKNDMKTGRVLASNGGQIEIFLKNCHVPFKIL